MEANLSAYVQQLRDALKACRMKFCDYVDIHQAKGTVAGDLAAKKNQRMVELCSAALAEPVPLALHDAQVLREAVKALEWNNFAISKPTVRWCSECGNSDVHDECERGTLLEELLDRANALEAEARKGAAPETGDVLEQERGK